VVSSRHTLGIALFCISRGRGLWGLFVGSGLLLVGLGVDLVVHCTAGADCYAPSGIPLVLVGLVLILVGLAAGAWYTTRP
jgi:hypothetical protein